jgi:hypothetical protein
MKMNKKFLIILLFVLGAFSLGGCNLHHVTKLSNEQGYGLITSRSLPDDSYERKGLVHAEFWTIAFIYTTPWLGNGEKKAKDALFNKAEKIGGTQVVDVDFYVETHMPVLGLIGWIEYHASGMAVKPKPRKKRSRFLPDEVSE